MPAEHCHNPDLRETMDAAESSVQIAETDLILNQSKVPVEYINHQNIYEEMYPSLHSDDNCNINGDLAGEVETFVHCNTNLERFEQYVTAEKSLDAYHNPDQCKCAGLSEPFYRFGQHCECFEVSKSFDNHDIASEFNQCYGNFTDCLHFSEQCSSSVEEVLPTEIQPSKKKDENCEDFEQCKIFNLLPGTSEFTETVDSLELCTKHCEYSENVNIVLCSAEDLTNKEHEKHPVTSEAKKVVEYSQIFTQLSCILLEEIHSSDFNTPPEINPDGSTHITFVNEYTDNILLAKESTDSFIEYDRPTTHCERSENLSEQMEKSQEQKSNKELCSYNSLVDTDEQTKKTFFRHTTEEDETSECFSTETTSFVTCIDDSFSPEPCSNSGKTHKGAQEDSSNNQSLWQCFEDKDAKECSKNIDSQDNPSICEIVIEDFFDLFDREETYRHTFLKRQCYTSCFEGGDIHDELKTNLACVKDTEKLQSEEHWGSKSSALDSKQIQVIEVVDGHNSCNNQGKSMQNFSYDEVYNVNPRDVCVKRLLSVSEETTKKPLAKEIKCEVQEAYGEEKETSFDEANAPSTAGCVTSEYINDETPQDSLSENRNRDYIDLIDEAYFAEDNNIEAETQEYVDDGVYEHCAEMYIKGDAYENEMDDAQIQKYFVAENICIDEEKTVPDSMNLEADVEDYHLETLFAEEDIDKVYLCREREPYLSFLEIEKEYQLDVEYYYTYAIKTCQPFFKEVACVLSVKENTKDLCTKEKVSEETSESSMIEESVCIQEGENSTPLVRIEDYSLETLDFTVNDDSKKYGQCKAGQLEFIGYIEQCVGFSDCIDPSVVGIQSNEQNKTPHTEQMELTEKSSPPLNIVDICVVSLNIETEHKEQTMQNETTETFFKMADENKVSEQSNTSDQCDYSDEDSEYGSTEESCECDYCIPTRQEVF